MTPLDRFRIAAEGYCDYIDSIMPGQQLEPLIRSLHTSLTEVYAAALSLPSLPVGDDDPETEPLTHKEWRTLYDRLRGVLGSADTYFTIWDSDGTDPQSMVEGSLADDLADTYWDLRKGLALDEAGETPDAVFEWRLLLWGHWGRHAANAIRELQLLRERKGWGS
jgi:hypothetical protein